MRRDGSRGRPWDRRCRRRDAGLRARVRTAPVCVSPRQHVARRTCGRLAVAAAHLWPGPRPRMMICRMHDFEVGILGPLVVHRAGAADRSRAAQGAAPLCRARPPRRPAVIERCPCRDSVARTGARRVGGDAASACLPAAERVDPGRIRGASSRIETHGSAYVLRVDADEIDAGRFEALAGAGRASLARNDPLLAARHLADALAQWRVSCSPTSPTSPSSPPARRLEELRLVATAQHIEAEIALGHDADVTAELVTLVAVTCCARHWGAARGALYRTGRQAEALRQYALLRDTLIEESGSSPVRPCAGSSAWCCYRTPISVSPPHRSARWGAARYRWCPCGSPLGSIRSSARPALEIDRALRHLGRHRRERTPRARCPRRRARHWQDPARGLRDREPPAGDGGGRRRRPVHGGLPPRLSAVRGGRRRAPPSAIRSAPSASEPGPLDRGRGESASRSTDPLFCPTPSRSATRYMACSAATLTATRLGGAPILALDALQWAASDASAGPHERAARHHSRGGLLVLATMRDTERNEPLDAMLADLARGPRVPRAVGT